MFKNTKEDSIMTHTEVNKLKTDQDLLDTKLDHLQNKLVTYGNYIGNLGREIDETNEMILALCEHLGIYISKQEPKFVVTKRK